MRTLPVFFMAALAVARIVGAADDEGATPVADLSGELAAAREAAATAETRCAEAERAAAILRSRLGAAEESIAALRSRMSDESRARADVEHERDVLARRLDPIHAKLAAATAAAAAADAELGAQVKRARDDSAQIRSLESRVAKLQAAADKAAAAPPPPEATRMLPPTAGDLEAVLDARTRENLDLKIRIGQLETRLEEVGSGSAAGPRSPFADDAGRGRTAPETSADRARMNALFEGERRTLLLIQSTTEEHLDTARKERDAALRDLKAAEKRIADMGKTLARRDTSAAEVLALGSDLENARREAREAHDRASAIARDKAATAREADRMRDDLARANKEIEILRGKLKTAEAQPVPPAATEPPPAPKAE